MAHFCFVSHFVLFINLVKSGEHFLCVVFFSLPLLRFLRLIWNAVSSAILSLLSTADSTSFIPCHNLILCLWIFFANLRFYQLLKNEEKIPFSPANSKFCFPITRCSFVCFFRKSFSQLASFEKKKRAILGWAACKLGTCKVVVKLLLSQC